MTTKQRVTLNTIVDLLGQQNQQILNLNQRIEAMEELTTKPETKATKSRKTAVKATKKAKLDPISKATPVTNNTGTKLVWLCMDRQTGKLFQTSVGDSKSFKANRAKGLVVGVLNLTANKLTIDNADTFIGKHNL